MAEAQLSAVGGNAPVAEIATTSMKPKKLSELLSEGKAVVLDGALATHLETLGADISTSLWSARLLHTAPHLIHTTHLAYFHSGAHVATTASYQASLEGLTTHLSTTPATASALIQKSVTLAQDARTAYLSSLPPREKESKEQTLLIAGSVGPYGAFLANGSEYTGAYTLSASDFSAFHAPRIEALLAAGADLLAIETIPNAAEAAALAALLARDFPTTEAIFAFTLAAADPTTLPDGTPLADIAALLNPYPNIVAVGVNCVPSDLALAGLRELAQHTAKPLVAYPNSGERWDAVARRWEGGREGGAALERRVREFWDVGVRVMGGCCRTGPEEMEVVGKVWGVCGEEGKGA